MGYKSDEWTNASGEMSGMLAHVRQNVSLLTHDRTANPYVLVVSLAFASAAEDGMPVDLNELEAADEAEEAIADRLETDHGALFGMAITTDGMQDLFFFLPNELPEADLERLIAPGASAFDYDFSLEKDPLWEAYAALGEQADDEE